MAKTYAITDMPADRLDPSLYFDEDRKATDKSYTKIAGVVRDFTFDHDRYGYTSDKATRLSRSQQMILEAAYRAGYAKGITFEFPHFMSPQSSYLQAGHLYRRYCEYFDLDV